MAEPYDPSRRNSILDRLGGQSPRDPPDDEGAVRESFSSSRPNSEDDLMLDIRLKDGARCALAYGTLMKVYFKPEDRLTLAFAANIVVIEGRRLLPLYELLRRHRARFIQEGNAAEEGLKPEDSAHVEHIHFEKPEEETV